MQNTDKGNIGQLIAKEQKELANINKITMEEQLNKNPSKKDTDSKKFNKQFEQAKTDAQNKIAASVKKRLNKMNKMEEIVPVYKQSIAEIIIGIKDAWFGIFSDIASFKIDGILTKNHRIFYIGLSFIIIGIILYVYEEFYSKIELIHEDITASEFEKEIMNKTKKEVTKYKDDLQNYIETTINNAIKDKVDKLQGGLGNVDIVGKDAAKVSKNSIKDYIEKLFKD